MNRLSLDEIRGRILDHLDIEDWQTPSELFRAIGLVNNERDWYRCALVCERLVHEGRAELQNPASRGKRYFRRVA